MNNMDTKYDIITALTEIEQTMRDIHDNDGYLDEPTEEDFKMLTACMVAKRTLLALSGYGKSIDATMAKLHSKLNEIKVTKIANKLAIF